MAYNPMTDPTILAFMRSSGLQKQLDEATALERTTQIEQRRDLTLEELEDLGQQEREGIAGSAETRGVFRSGQRLMDEAKSDKRQARRAALASLGAAEQLTGLRSGVDQASLERQRALEELTLSGASTYAENEAEEEAGLGIGGTLAGMAEFDPSKLPGSTAPQPAQPVAGVGISRQKRRPILGGYAKDF